LRTSPSGESASHTNSINSLVQAMMNGFVIGIDFPHSGFVNVMGLAIASPNTKIQKKVDILMIGNVK
ncbi:MAG: hypothetical protein K2L11_02575, partial [Muribaculaceae bacterium]|nr:hypothetical protein [Muribaculaceae bacterium]